MMDEKLEAGLNEAVDGVLSPEDEPWVREALDRDPEARAYHEDLSRLGALLAEVESVDPPAALKTNVLRAVRALPVPGSGVRTTAAPARIGWTEAVAGFFRAPGYSRVALSFGAGIAVGLIVFALSSPSPRPDRNSLTGTMISQSPAVPLSPVASRRFSLGDAEGTLATRVGAGGSSFLAILDRGAARFELTLGEGIRPLGVDRGPGSEGAVSLERGRVVIDATTPGWTSVRFEATGAGATDAIGVRVTAGGETVEEVLPLGGGKN